jgi:hypothetical protein
MGKKEESSPDEAREAEEALEAKEDLTLTDEKAVEVRGGAGKKAPTKPDWDWIK